MNKSFLIILFATLFILLSGCSGDLTVINDTPPSTLAPSSSESGVSLPPYTSPNIPSSEPELVNVANIQILTSAQTDNIYFAVNSEGVFCIYNGSYGESARKYGFMDCGGTELTKFVYDYAYPFSEGLACVRMDGKYGFIDIDGNIALPLIYDNATPFAEGLAYFEQGDTYGFIDKDGNIVFLLDCDSVSTFQDGLAFFSIDGRYGYIDMLGNVAIAPAFDDAGFFKNELAKVRVGSTYGFIDKNGAFVVPPIYSDITVDGEYFHIRSGDLYGLLDSSGQTILQPVYDYLELLSDMAIVNIDGSEKIIGFDGAVRMPDEYDYFIYDDGCDLIRVSVDGKHGFLDVNSLSVVIPIIYDYTGNFVGEYAAAQLDGRYGVIDKRGDVVIPFDYDWINVFDNETFAVSSNGKYGLLDRNGQSIHQMEYDSIQHHAGGYVVQHDNKYGFLDESCKKIISPVYDYCLEWVYGTDNCFVVNKGYGPGSHSIAVLGDIHGTDISDLLLRNEITPRLKPYSQFLKEGFVEHESMEDSAAPTRESMEDNTDFIRFYKLYKIGDGAPILYFYARPFRQSGFPMSYSGFFTMKGGEINILVTGYECGGSMGGDYICFWQDNKTQEIYIGTSYHYGGFGGYAYGGNIYEYKDGSAVPLVSFGMVEQSARNYDRNELLENAGQFYDSNGAPYTKNTILQAQEDYEYITEYSVNDKRTTVEKYRNFADMYSMFMLWSWGGY